MKTKSSGSELTIFIISFFVVLSSLHNNYQEQYKFGSIDLAISNQDIPVECLVEPVPDSIRINLILSGFGDSKTNHSKQIIGTSNTQHSVCLHKFLQTQGINPQYVVVPPEVTLFHPFISVLHKSQPCHSCQEDNPLPDHC